MGEFLIYGLGTGIAWPAAQTHVEYRGRLFTLRPGNQDIAPTVLTHFDPPTTLLEAQLAMERFLSALAWSEGSYVRVETVTGGGLPFNVGRGRAREPIRGVFHPDHLPDPTDPRAQLALAFYREALGLESVPFRVLGFFKIINILHGKGPDQVRWINRTLPSIADYPAAARLAELRQQQRDIGAYLYESGRCAVAHANVQPLVDPENPSDLERLQADLPLLRALAEYAIENDFGIKSSRTIRSQHLYELEGFRNLLGPELLARLTAREAVPMSDLPTLPLLSFGVRDSPEFPSFRALTAVPVHVEDGSVVLRCTSRDGKAAFVVALNFAEERLGFDAIGSIAVTEDGSSTVVGYEMDRIRFARSMLLNGRLEIWDAERSILLGRSDPLIPENLDSLKTIASFDSYTASLQGELERRRKEESGAAEKA